MTEEREKYDAGQGEPEEPGIQQPAEDVHKVIVQGMIDTITKYPAWFACLLSREQAQVIVTVIREKYHDI